MKITRTFNVKIDLSFEVNEVEYESIPNTKMWEENIKEVIRCEILDSFNAEDNSLSSNVTVNSVENIQK